MSRFDIVLLLFSLFGGGDGGENYIFRVPFTGALPVCKRGI